MAEKWIQDNVHQEPASSRAARLRNHVKQIVFVKTLTPLSSELASRRGARHLAEVPSEVLARLQAGDIETVNLMEWLAADMSALARNLAARARSERLRSALEQAASTMAGQRLISRLTTAGRALAEAIPSFDDPDFRSLAEHASDLVRQWACYAVNHAGVRQSIAQRLTLTLPFAADRNMSVREAAWMAFRPHAIGKVQEAIALLEPISREPDASLRRFAIETTRPRSVWGAHIEMLKRRPEIALPLLENVRQDEARYVQLAAGNWLNDASKSRPEWVVEICARWYVDSHPHTAAIVRRGLRTLIRRRKGEAGYNILSIEPVFAGLS